MEYILSIIWRIPFIRNGLAVASCSGLSSAQLASTTHLTRCSPGMMGSATLTSSSPCLTSRFVRTRHCFWADLAAAPQISYAVKSNYQLGGYRGNVNKGVSAALFSSSRWKIHCINQIGDVSLSCEEDKQKWEACREAFSAFDFSIEEQDKILAKAFGQVHSPYWSEERTKETPSYEVVKEILDYLRSLSLSDDDLQKLLKKFPEVLGCNIEDEVRNNVKVLEKQWGIKGKSLRNLLLRNPKVLGYNVDCKGDCEAKCTRCWVRF